MTEKKLVPVFMPALVVLLIKAEDVKGTPLSKDEVLHVRDHASVVMLGPDAAEKMAESRGYADIDPENCWYDWQMVRREMGRLPDLDPGARFIFSNPADDALKAAAAEARRTLPRFRQLIGEFGAASFPLIKTKLSTPEYSANMWLQVIQVSAADFSAALFEVPSEFDAFKIGDAFTMRDGEILDWMINRDGTLHGGYSLRVQRERLGAAEQAAFDAQIGVERYAPLG